MPFQAGQVVSAAAINSAAPTGETESVVSTVFGSTTSTTYTLSLTGTGTVTLPFVTPASGKISVTYTASISPQASGNYGVISVGISGAAGVIAPSDDWQAFAKTTSGVVNDNTAQRTKLFTGLAPGSAGTITMYYKVTAGTTNFNDRQLRWRPVAA